MDLKELDERNRRALRQMAWERAKGELNAMLHTTYPEDSTNHFEALQADIQTFIAIIEDNGRHE